jgi:hypothetical protein
MKTSEPGPPARRPYEAPAIVSEQMFETTALACGKLVGELAKCKTRPKAS